MKKISIFLAFILCFSFLNVNAYSISNVIKNTTKYEQDFSKKIDLSKIDTKRLEKLKKQIESLITKIENDTTKSNFYKENMLGKLIALGNLIDKKLDSSITITIIDDKRCTNCQTDSIIDQLKQLPFLVNADFIKKDFSDATVSEYLKTNNISYLPAIILSTNKLDDSGTMSPYLQELNSNEYSLNVGASFNPFLKRSEKGFLVLDKEIIIKVKENAYLKGNKDAKISWFEYSDLECPFCARLHNSDVESSIKETYKEDVNIYFNHFPLEFHQNAFIGASVLECLAEQKGAGAFYSLIDVAYKNEKSDKSYLIEESVKLGANKETIEKCINDQRFNEKISEIQNIGNKTFGINGTPGNVLINNETGEYEIISGAYPFEEFKRVIDGLLK